MKCHYCLKELELKRFLKENYDGDFVNERFVFLCKECNIVISPKFLLIDCCETEKERQVLRDLYFQEYKREAQEVKK